MKSSRTMGDETQCPASLFIIPFTENDKYDFVDEKECRIFLEMLRNQYGRYETENFSSIVPRKIDEQCVISKQII